MDLESKVQKLLLRNIALSRIETRCGALKRHSQLHYPHGIGHSGILRLHLQHKRVAPRYTEVCARIPKYLPEH